MKNMTKAKFEIGGSKEHTFLLERNWVMKHIKIGQYVETVVNEFHYSPSAKKFQFEVGTPQHHRIEITT